MQKNIKKIVSFVLIYTLLFNLIRVFLFNDVVQAVDSDWSAHLAMTMTPSVSTTQVVAWRNFNYNVNITNTDSSEWDAFKYGYILQLPVWVSFISSPLWSPDRTVVHNSWFTLHFFRTDLPLLKWLSKSNSFTLTTNSWTIWTPKDIKILWYANDNIYWVWKPPVWSPPSTLTWWIDFANSIYFTWSTTFPENIIATSNISILPFTWTTINTIPFDITKSESTSWLVWDEVTTTLTITNNNLGPLTDINIQDIIPKNRKFVSFTSTWWVWSIDLTYDSPSYWNTKIDFKNIDIATSGTLNISYKTLLLSHDILSYSWSTVFNTWSNVDNWDSSINQAIPHTWSLASGSLQSYWNNWVSNIAVNTSTLPSQKNYNSTIHFANIWKSVDKPSSTIWEVLTYTIEVDVSDEFDLLSSWDNTYIDDVLPDGMNFSWMLSSSLTIWSWTPFSLSWSTINWLNWDTTVRWILPSGVITAWSKAQIRYQAVIDWIFEWTGPTQYVNNDIFTNTATLTYKVWWNHSWTWWFTENSLVDQVYSDSASASTRAPTPTMNKQLVKVVVPGGSTYDSSNPLGVNDRITVWSKLTFAISADFPNVYFTWIILKDALPLLTWPNNQVYDIAFQTNSSLQDMEWDIVPINDNNWDSSADTSFNTKSLSWTTIPNSSWISISDPNYINFDLWSGNWWNSFSILITVDILPNAPESIDPDWLNPLLNVATWEYRNAWWTLYSDLLKEVPFVVATPKLNITKTASWSSVSYWNQVDYTVTITNSGAAPAYAENILDVIPANMNLDSWSIVYSWSVSNITNSNITQSWTSLNIEFGTWVLGSSRSLIPINDAFWVTPEKENIIVIKYTLKPTVDFIIWNPLARTNNISLDYYSTPSVASLEVNNYWPISASASFNTAVPTIGRVLYSTTETDSTWTGLYIWEEATFDTTITFSWWTYINSYYIDSIQDTTMLDFLTWSIVSYSWSLNFNSGAVFSSTWYINFWNLVNTDNTPSTRETIVLRTRYRLKTNATAQTNRTTTWRYYYNSTNISANSNINYRLPTTTIVKSVNPTTADASDIVTYSIKVTNTSANAHWYDYTLTDIMPVWVTYIPWSLTWNIAYTWNETDFFSWSWIIIDRLLPSNWSGTISYTAQVSSWSIAWSTKNNVVNMSLSTLDDDSSIYERTYTWSSNVNITIKDITINHAISWSDLADTSSSRYNAWYPDIAIWEEVTYRINVNLAELDYNWVTLTQTLPTWLKFITWSILTDNVESHTLSTITLSWTTQIVFNFWDIVNVGWTWTWFVLETKAVLLDNWANTAWTTKNSSIRIDYNSTNFKTDNTPYFDIVEPSLSITKDYSPNSWDGWDSIPTTITVTNNWSAPAYDISISDFTPAKTTTWVWFYSSTWVSVINPGASVTYSYNTILDNTVTYWELLTWTASVVYTSYPSNPTQWERSYNTSDTDSISIVWLSWLSKTLLTPDKVKIADKSSYRLAFPIPEWVTNNILINDSISTWTIIDPSSIVITTSTWVTYSWTITPSYNISSDSIWAWNSQVLTYSFNDIINSDVDNGQTEFIYINYDVIVVNSTDNNSWNSKSSPVSANYNSWTTILNASPLPIEVQEPNISLNISNIYTDWYNANILFTITNNWNTWAYDVNLNTLLSSWLSYTWSISITNSWGAVNLVKSWDNFTIDYLIVNTWNPLTFTINTDISNSILNWESLSLTWNLQYTSQNWTYTSTLANSLDTERNGTNSPVLNDYFTSWSTNLITKYAILNESITVDKPSWIIWNKFTYTITLANSWSVNLTWIDVNLDISDSFTGFTVTSIPGWSTDNSNNTWWINSMWQLKIAWISLAIWQTRTITYDVYAKNTVVDWTVVNTIATVWNSIEWANWWTPSVPVTIYAPKFSLSTVEIDDNWWSLYNDETITHNITLNNIWTSTWTNVLITISYSTWFTFSTWSFNFMSWTLANTWTLEINDSTRTITFIIPVMWSWVVETLDFKTIATWPVWSINKTTVTLVSSEWPWANWVSNEVIIVAKQTTWWGTSGWWWSTISKDYCKDWDYSLSYYDGKCWTKPTEIPKILEEKKKDEIKETPKTEEKKIDEEKDEQKEENTEKIISKMSEIFKEFTEKKARLDEIIASENERWKVSFENLPKILPKTWTQILYRTKIVKNDRLNLTVSEKDISLAWKYNDDINYRKTSLPETDKNASEIIVTPSNGMVIPIINVDNINTDYKELISGREIDVNKYLKWGALKYPWTWDNWYSKVWNPVIFGHSSYFKKDDWRYKTLFQKIIELDAWEQIWIYQKQTDWIYKRFIYIVEKSYEVTPSSVDILNAWIWKNLTLFTCTPIWNLTWRWIVKAKYYDEEKIALEKELYWKDISIKEKKMFKNLIKKLSTLEKTKKGEIIIKIFKILDSEKVKAFSENSIKYLKLLLTKECYK